MKNTQFISQKENNKELINGKGKFINIRKPLLFSSFARRLSINFERYIFKVENIKVNY